MRSVLGLLDLPEEPAGPAVESWWEQVADSLSQDELEWLDATGRAAEFNTDRAWTLLSWIEFAASVVGRQRSHHHLELAAFSMSLLEDSGIDRRDRAIVAALLHRAAVFTGMDFVACVTLGCGRAGERGAACIGWLAKIEAVVPDTHEEVQHDGALTFTRKPSGFDVSDLEAWLDGEK